MDKCKDCEHFYECDNMGYYEECQKTTKEQYKHIVIITREFDGDTYDDEYSGIYHDTYEAAKEEWKEAAHYFPKGAGISTRIVEVED